MKELIERYPKPADRILFARVRIQEAVELLLAVIEDDHSEHPADRLRRRSLMGEIVALNKVITALKNSSHGLEI